MTVELRRDVVIVTCAISAGIHAALVPGHVAEGAGAAAGFVAASVLAAASAVVLTLRPKSALALAGAATVLGGLLASYGFAVTTGLPVLHSEPEPVAGLAIATKAIEAGGLLAALTVIRRPSVAVALPHPKGT